ncbi:hypothetical protein F5B17DRAFT_216702 [Nemania serpens]|nr:hypothetical protein F5B17DRAFT_216702 [Nemania serpens]
MAAPGVAPQEARYPMDGAISDGGNEGSPPDLVRHGVPWYDGRRDADAVPKYTREYLQGLSTLLNSRLKTIDDDVSYYPDALAKTRRSHRCLSAVLTLLGLLWLATSIIILVAVLRTYNKRAPIT